MSDHLEYLQGLEWECVGEEVRHRIWKGHALGQILADEGAAGADRSTLERIGRQVDRHNFRNVAKEGE